MASSTNKKALDLKKQEINYFYGKIGEVEALLKEQQKLNSRLRSDVEGKIQQIMAVEALLASEKERFRWRKETLLTDMDIQQESGDEKLKELRSIEDDISIAIAEYDFVAVENEKLHNRYKEMIHEQELIRSKNTKEREERKQKDFDTRISLEVIFRQCVKSADDDYKLKASEKMGSEAVVAGQENIALKAAKGKWEEMCETLVKQQQLSYEELVKARVATEVIAATTSMQEASLMAMDEHNNTLLNEIELLRSNAQFLVNDIEGLERHTERLRELDQQHAALKKSKMIAKAARKEACANAVSFCQQVLMAGLQVVERDQTRKACKLSNVGGPGVLSPDDDQNEGALQSGSTQSTVSDTSRSLIASHRPVASASSPGKVFDPDAVWNSHKSDIHMAEVLRRTVREQRSR